MIPEYNRENQTCELFSTIKDNNFLHLHVTFTSECHLLLQQEDWPIFQKPQLTLTFWKGGVEMNYPPAPNTCGILIFTTRVKQDFKKCCQE